ncbi:unnamed protein product [Acanthoscelides obtectus]|uniref:Uncharacterized protein n=1 Tax=Acanthoscelides obtectus TaxID=200917 RepID=A0A9P0LX02_ACAOB|nr:unnamed protein product [Acanthoscelides obtectus]CAK1646931.1 hypothetical protein AOBTE_LOCUS14951 [Acanthoscelides obtectus]
MIIEQIFQRSPKVAGCSIRDVPGTNFVAKETVPERLPLDVLGTNEMARSVTYVYEVEDKNVKV